MLAIFKKKSIITAGTALLLFAVSSLVYASGTYFNICLDRSVNIVPPADKTKISDTGDSVTLNKKGRLWLTGNETKEGFVEIVCQNLSAEPVNVALATEENPWLEITGTTQCGDWKNNLLICSVGKMEKGFFCKITERKAIKADEDINKQMSASVNVRAVNIQDDPKKWFDEQMYLQKRIDYYAAGIDLCSTMHKKTGNILVSWVIYAGGSVDKVDIDSSTAPENKEVAHCIAEQIALWKFPEWQKNSQISYQF